MTGGDVSDHARPRISNKGVSQNLGTTEETLLTQLFGQKNRLYNDLHVVIYETTVANDSSSGERRLACVVSPV